MIEFETKIGEFLILELPYKPTNCPVEMMLQMLKPAFSPQSLTEEEKVFLSYTSSKDWNHFPNLLFNLREYFSDRIVGECENPEEEFDKLLLSLDLDRSKNYVLFKKANKQYGATTKDQ